MDIKTTKFQNIIALLLPFVLFYAAFDSGSYQQIPIYGLSGLIFLLLIVRNATFKSLLFFSKSILIPFAIFALSIIGSFFYTKSYSSSIFELIYFLAIISVALLTYGFDDILRKKFLYITIFGATVIIIIGFVYYMMPIVGYIERSHDMINYFFATFYWKNPAAGYLSLFIPILFWGLVVTTKKTRIIYAILFNFFSLAFLLTRSRGAWLSLVISSAIFVAVLIFSKKKRKLCQNIMKNISHSWLILLISIICISATSYLLIPKDSSRQTVQLAGESKEIPQERSSMERRKMLDMGLRIVKDYPFGVGAGAFLIVYPRYLESSYYLSKHLHNQYLQFATEVGIIGAIAFFIMLLMILIALFRNIDEKSDELQLGITIGALALFLHIALDFDWTFAGITLPCFALIGAALDKNKKAMILRKNSHQAISIFVIAVLAILSFISLFAENIYTKAITEKSEYESKLTLSTKLAPWNSLYKYMLGNHFLNTGEIEKAQIQIEKAYRLQPEFPQANYVLGQIYFNKGEREEGLELIRKSIEYAPYSAPENQLRLAKLLIATGDTSSGRDYLENLTGNFSSEENTQYTEKTYSYRYYVGRAHLELARLQRVQNKMQIAQENYNISQKLLQPRKYDNVAKKIGFETFSPEWVAIRDFERQIEDSTLLRFTGINEVMYDFWQAKALVRFYYIKRENTEDKFMEYEAKTRLTFEGKKWKVLH